MLMFLSSLDPSVDNLMYSDTTAYMAQTVTTAISCDVDLLNDASAGGGNDIPAATGGSENFEFLVEMSDVDLSDGGNTNGLSFVAVTATITSGDVTQALTADGGTASSTFSGTANVTLTTGDCPTVSFLCIRVRPGVGALYTDANPSFSDNTVCLNISTYVICAPGTASL